MAGYQNFEAFRPVFSTGRPAAPLVNRQLVRPDEKPQAKPAPIPEPKIEQPRIVEGKFIPPKPVKPGTMLAGRIIEDDEVFYTIADAARIAAHATATTRCDLLSSRRLGELVKARQIGMWLARQYTVASLPMIGKYFGDRDHTTALHGVRRVEFVIRACGLTVLPDPVAMASALWSVDWPRAPK